MKRDNPIAPRLANTLLRRFCDPRWLEEIEGDLQEQFAVQAHEEGLLKARLVYWRDVLLLSARPYVRNQQTRHYQQARGPFMLSNYMKITLRLPLDDPRDHYQRRRQGAQRLSVCANYSILHRTTTFPTWSAEVSEGRGSRFR